MTPDEIVALFQRSWAGTEDELHEALEYFYNDIRDSFKAAGSPEETLVEVDDYVGNHYF